MTVYGIAPGDVRRLGEEEETAAAVKGKDGERQTEAETRGVAGRNL